MLSISNNRYVILFIINILLLVIGTFMDMTPACLIFTPIFLPICQKLGMNTVHFGIMMIFNLCIGTITPPVGTTLFVGVKVGKTKIENVIKPLLLYFAAILSSSCWSATYRSCRCGCRDYWGMYKENKLF